MGPNVPWELRQVLVVEVDVVEAVEFRRLDVDSDKYKSFAALVSPNTFLSSWKAVRPLTFETSVLAPALTRVCTMALFIDLDLAPPASEAQAHIRGVPTPPASMLSAREAPYRNRSSTNSRFNSSHAQ
jgi:hypothetical protein